MVDRERMQRELEERTREAEKTNDSYGGNFGNNLFIEDVSLWKCSEDEHIIDIIPYGVGPNHPKIDEGKSSYYFEFFTHRNVGPNNDSYLCLKDTYGERCPICEHQLELMRDDDYDEDEVKALYPSKRTLYNIICCDSDKEIEKGVQPWHVAHFYMQKKLVPLAAKNKRTGQGVPFANPDVGKSIQFTRKGTGLTGEYYGHQFIERVDGNGDEYIISDEELESAYILEDLIVKPTYGEVYEAYFGEPPVEKSVDESKVDESKDEPEEKPKGRSGRTGRTTKKETKEKKPKGRAGRTSKSKKEVKEEKEDKKETNECPYDYKFGFDLGIGDECNDCDVWDDCRARKKEIKEAEDK